MPNSIKNSEVADLHYSPELRTEVTDVTEKSWVGKIHRGDGSVINVEVQNLENLFNQPVKNKR